MSTRFLSNVRENVITLRKSHGYSQSELARQAGLRPSYICDLEAGRKNGITDKTVESLAMALGVTAAYLGGEKIGSTKSKHGD